jgi:hypothetical protein
MRNNNLSLRVGRVYHWLDQGPAVLLEECDVEKEAVIDNEEVDDVVPDMERGWVISLLMTGEILTVHEETLSIGEEK